MGLTELRVQNLRVQNLRVHDLLRVPFPAAVTVVDPPFWLGPALAAAPWVVVRRAAAHSFQYGIPVGIRGASRDQRCAAFLDPATPFEVVTPQDLVARQAWREAARPDHPVVRALARHAAAFTATGLDWGVAGGAGFELASRAPVLGPTSDLDLVIRIHGPLPQEVLRGFAQEAACAQVRVDVLVETPAGGFSLAEFVAGTETLLLRTPEGPRLVERARLLSADSP